MFERLTRWAIAPVGIAMLLSGCGDEAASGDEAGAASASGEVLEGTISDEMLPIEDLQSQPPVAAPAPGAGGSGEGASDSGDSVGLVDEAANE